MTVGYGTEVMVARTQVKDRTSWSGGAFASIGIQEHVHEGETIRAVRVALGLLGDGFVEAVADQTFVELARKQCKDSHHKICGQVLYVPVVEAPRETGVGRYGWKDQHASLVSFSGDAYRNVMGITNTLFPAEVPTFCNAHRQPTDPPVPTGLVTNVHVDALARAPLAAPEASPRWAANAMGSAASVHRPKPASK